MVLTSKGTFGLEGAFAAKLLTKEQVSSQSSHICFFLPYYISFLDFVFLDDLLWNLPPSKIHWPSKNPALKVVHGHVTKWRKDWDD